MSHLSDRIAAFHPPEREKLDAIRRELEMGKQKDPCPKCGNGRAPHGPVPGKPREPDCTMCGGRRVRAANILRVIRDLARVEV